MKKDSATTATWDKITFIASIAGLLFLGIITIYKTEKIDKVIKENHELKKEILKYRMQLQKDTLQSKK